MSSALPSRVAVALAVLALVGAAAAPAQALTTTMPAPTQGIGAEIDAFLNAVGNSPTLGDAASHLTTTELQVAADEAAAAVGGLNSAYAGGSGGLFDGLAGSHWPTADQINQITNMRSALAADTAAAADGGSVATLAGSETLDLAAGAGVTSIALPATLAVAAGTLGYMDITTGTNPISVALFGTSTDGPSPAPSSAGSSALSVDQERWRTVQLPAVHDDGLCFGQTPTQLAPDVAGPASAGCVKQPGADQVGDTIAYLLEARHGAQWYFSPQIYALNPSSGSYIGDIHAPIDPGSAGNCGGSAPSYFPGWPPTVPNSSTFYGAGGGTQQWQLNCRANNASPSNGYQGTWVLSTNAAILRPGGKFKKGFPRAKPAGAPASGSAATPHPVAPGDWPGFLAAVRGLQAQLHAGKPQAAQLLDHSFGAQIGGAVVPAPGTFTIPAPTPHELASDYVTQLHAAGFPNVVLSPSTTVNPAVGPNEVASVSPAVSTAADPASTVTVKANPADAPSPGVGPGQSVGAPGCSLTPPSSSLDLSPITSLQFGQTFPFSVLPWVSNALGGVVTPGQRPQATFSVFGQSVSTGDSLAPLDSVFVALRTFLAALLWLGVVWSLWRRTLGGAREV